MSKDIQLQKRLYKKLYLIRRAEERIRDMYFDDEMKTPMHMSRGGEAIAVGVLEAAGEKSQAFGTYRSHALYLARTMETDKFFAEMYGREAGAAKGLAGSMHLASPEAGVMMTSAVVATTIPVAVGAAFANAYQENGKLVVSFFGDGAINEGVFWESINFAALKKLPILFVCEDNDFAIHSRVKDRIAHTSIGEIAKQFGFVVAQTQSTDAGEICNITKDMLEEMKKIEMPGFLYTKYYRYLEHVGVNEDFEAGYRERTEAEEWMKRDPIELQRKKLLESGVPEQEIVALEEAVTKDIEESIAKAKDAPFPKKTEVFENLYA